jgi:hypothetical protein
VTDLQLQKETLVIDLQLQKDHLATFEITLCYRGADIIWSKQWVLIRSTLDTTFTSEIMTSCHAQMDPGGKEICSVFEYQCLSHVFSPYFVVVQF